MNRRNSRRWVEITDGSSEVRDLRTRSPPTIGTPVAFNGPLRPARNALHDSEKPAGARLSFSAGARYFECVGDHLPAAILALPSLVN